MLDVVLNDWVIETKDTIFVKQFDELGKVSKRPGKPVDLVDDDDIDLAVSDLVEKGLQGRALQRSSGQTAVIEPTGNGTPAFVGLALDVASQASR